MSPMPMPSIEYGLLSPMLIVFGAAVVGVLIEAFLPGHARYAFHLVVSVGGLLLALVAVILLAGTSSSAVLGAVAVDGPTLFMQGTIVLISIVAVLLISERGATVESTPAMSSQGSVAVASSTAVLEREAVRTEVFPLTLFAIGGMLLFPAANDLLTMFVALEVLSLPLYLLCGFARHRRLLSQEAALKYFLLGAFSSAFFLYGVAMLYGYAGTVKLAGIADAIAAHSGSEPMALIGTALILVGLLFKVGAVPFHSWIPDVYQGAPTPITGFMAAATKVAAFGALFRLLYVALPGLRDDWRPVLWGIAIATMLIGAVLAVTQTDVKRMLAYSSVAHAGFILTGIIAGNRAGLSSTMFYLLSYGISTVGAFAVIGLVRDGNVEATQMSRWAGLGRRSPLIATIFALFLLAFAGIPLTSGFVSKFAVFQAAASGGAVPLVVVGVISSAIAAFFYVRVIMLMFFTDPPENPPVVMIPSAVTAVAILVGAAATLLLGVAPQPVLDLADHAAVFFR